jgi:hypothetical protein
MSIDANGRKHESSGTTGGQFAVQAKAAPETALRAPLPQKVGILAVATLDTNGLPALPQWPTELAEPSTSYSWDEDGHLEVIISFGPDALTVWGSIANPCDSFTEIPGERPDIPLDAADRAVAYGYQLHENLASLAGQVEYAAHTGAVRSAVLAAAKGEREPVELYDSEDPTSRTPAQRATTRTEAGLAAWFGEDVHESTLQDVLTDLLHYADAQGISPAEFGGIFYRAQGIQRNETESPEG